MSVLTGADIPQDVFGGTLTEVGLSNMPSGGSPANLNVEFLPGLVRTRGGLQVKTNYNGIGSGLQARYLKSYGITPENETTLVLLVNPTLDATGIVAAGNTVIGNVYGYGATQPWSPYSANPGWGGPLAKSSTQFGREYIAISEGRYGYDIPRQWDGTNYDRVSQCGPGQSPIAADATMSFGLGSMVPSGPLTITNIESDSSNSNIIDVTFSSAIPAGTMAGDSFLISGTTAYNGTFTIAAIISSLKLQFYIASPPGTTETAGSAQFGIMDIILNVLGVGFGFPVPMGIVMAGASPSAYNTTYAVRGSFSSAGHPGYHLYSSAVLTAGSVVTKGTVSLPGNISAGLHQVSVAFITRQGYITKPSPPSSWTAAGSHSVLIANIPTGPSNVVGRLLLFTVVLVPPASTGTFYSVRQPVSSVTTTMQINDNTTTFAFVNFADSDLTQGFSAQYLFDLVELGACAGSFPYAGRMFWWGELNSMQQFLNMEFNGGWSIGTGTSGSDVPLGWVSDPTDGSGGKRLANGGVWQDAFQITGAGAPGAVGMITQEAFEDWLLVPILAGGTSYSARITAKASNAADNLVLEIYSPSQGSIATITLGGWGTSYSTQIAAFSASTPAVIPMDAIIRLYANGLTTAHLITIDRVEIFSTNQPINYTVLRASLANDPESFDGVTGLIQPIFTNGQAIRCVYVLRDSMYIVCDRSTFVTKDSSGSEPALWTVDPVSDAVGCTGPNAAGGGEDWEVKANRYGLYIYLGREPEKISQEIQSLWNKEGLSNIVNWQYGYKIWVSVDLLNKRVYVGAPVNGATEVNQIFVMDYNTLDTSTMIAEYPTLRFSPYTGRRVILEQGRKWTVWTFQTEGGTVQPIPCGAFIEQSDGTAQFLLGGDADSNVYFIDPTQRGNDNGAPVTSSYTQAFTPSQEEEQALQLRSQMHALSFLRPYVKGVGTLRVQIYENTLDVTPTNPRLIANINLKNPALIDQEETIDDAVAERFSLEWSTSALDEWWQIERTTKTVEQSPNGIVRGTNLA